ncbi:pyrroloquinoline quinone biosynthesis peptide chaperone PqqD [Colwellia sp. 4_MG-2023]|uniref:pyrroloquinoline quinone biosynthesis peptide chaperone PqqD n=1 Tax=unclassified Colwellia TaxID=196834 RepID=UPI0026E45393|nr:MULTISPECIES: pyrroloquinoline quinone biosynthesis peptide chaperone PqqD [unclassified Colwellia]MDO6506176.1 pyrroloquinoline quinone biosynthesis peptide chaperone PqqD [Colwellia sp. 5_MG-2023]MDO6554764.1 pyrroloquinoline quinone biosynthesis peptide chaperone PqqD [Colwellia sp. 4_MG-2023]MDO6652033.1 pyrroloquinoline quinone biosynthesis peptide chaperone PqqD [Colwellia sp. 3_MG-2023]MDO6664809.1 pyrroloquinoline quinone biosynthesis peptide chaperone PqqD [Colwellia sp. 2_MG-2023]
MSTLTITPTMTPSLNRMFRFQWEKAQDCFVLLFPEGMVKLNGGAGEIMQLIDGQKNVQEIIDVLHAKFPDAGNLATDVNEFITTAIEKKWLYHD